MVILYCTGLKIMCLKPKKLESVCKKHNAQFSNSLIYSVNDRSRILNTRLLIFEMFYFQIFPSIYDIGNSVYA